MKILQDDGSEIAAQVVLRDRDLDLAFIRPTVAPTAPMPAIDLTKSVTPGLLDPVITINRLGKVASREYAVSIERVSAIVSRPRTFYVMGNDPTQTALGCPALSLDGDAIGLCVMRSIKRGGDSGGMGMFSGGGDTNMLAIIVPASDVLEVAKQAPAAGEEAKEIGTEPKEEQSGEPKAEDAPADKPDGTIEVKPEVPKA